MGNAIPITTSSFPYKAESTVAKASLKYKNRDSNS